MKRHHTSIESESNDDDDDEIYSESTELTVHSCTINRTSKGHYQSNIYTGLISPYRHYSNGNRLTRLEQLVTTAFDDQIRSLLLTLRHHVLNYHWSNTILYLKYLLQSCFNRPYTRLYWQLLFKCILENEYENKIDESFLPQIFDTLFHSPLIDHTYAFYSYLCLHLFDLNKIDLIQDLILRYQNRKVYNSGRTITKYYNESFEQFLLLKIQFLINYRQWINENNLLLNINPFLFKFNENNLDNNVNNNNIRDIELWTFKLTTDFNVIEDVYDKYFDTYDTHLLKYISFLYSTNTTREIIETILNNYSIKHSTYINAQKYLYWYYNNSQKENDKYKILKQLVDLDPSSTPYVLNYCQYLFNNHLLIELFDYLFDYLDYYKNKYDLNAWTLFNNLFILNDIKFNNSLIECLKQNWMIRQTIWIKYHFNCFQNKENNELKMKKALIAYLFLPNKCTIQLNDIKHNYLTQLNDKQILIRINNYRTQLT
ncbi:unnamed protein product [Didymodactylos carnosus]|uniref:Uncharacterized protein n=1 Tax=Didymodactylos carnosus TaxID=1234261 RepID=A0A813XZT0_9BILA|nr:unnamed protein product [Didymodactylos carnosus]CAF0882806.1 unnamed protein product [Didymodactylos carnosus]CAF3661566.1 unnamed protein product [Didymodactylos carnosus]CAF3666321.1 unnamed protein product [Didymodactylos carnosus]